jgi:hypothetical protein
MQTKSINMQIKSNTNPPTSQQEKEKKLNLIQLLYNLPEQAISILNYLIRLNNKHEFIYPTQATIASATGLCRKTVNQWCQKLQRMGIFHMLYTYWAPHLYTFDGLFSDLSFRCRIEHILVSCRFIPLHHLYMKSVTHINKLKDSYLVLDSYKPFSQGEFLGVAPVVTPEMLKEMENWENELELESRIASIYDQTGEVGHVRVHHGAALFALRIFPSDDCICTQDIAGASCCRQENSPPLWLPFGCL